MLCLLETTSNVKPEWKTKIEGLEQATTLTALIMMAWQLARMVAVELVEDV